MVATIANHLPFLKADPEATLKRALAQEARWYADVITKKLVQLGVCYRFARSQRDWGTSGVQKVRFKRAITTPEAIYLELDDLHLPRGIRLDAITEVLDDLSVACRRPVRFKRGVEAGAWLIIERGSGHFGVPAHLDFATVVEHFPTESYKFLVVPLGVGENRKLIYRSLADMPHALVGGATSAGKSTFIHAWICTMIQRNTPDQLRLALVDLKGGVEFAYYKGLPHLYRPVIKERDQVVSLLEELYQLVETRLQLFEKAEVQNIAAYNYKHRLESLYRVVLVVDEMANIMLDTQIKRDAQRLLADITARGRAPGVHVVLATQRPEVAVVPGLIKANLDARIAFRMTDFASSNVILDDTGAARFDDTTPPGRFIYKRGLDRIVLQAPLITAGQIKELVQGILQGEQETVQDAGRVPPEEILATALKINNFTYRAIYQALGGRVGRTYIEHVMRSYEGKVIELNGISYVLTGKRGNVGRHLVPVGEATENSDVSRA